MFKKLKKLIKTLLGLKPMKQLELFYIANDKQKIEYKIESSFKVLCRIDTPVEVEYYRHGGILQYVLRQLLD